MPDIREDVLFWSGIMRDHAIFQANAFTVKETDYIETSLYYRKYFQNIVKKLEGSDRISEKMYTELLNVLESFIEYKKCILKSLLMCNIQMNFPPTLISHQINEAKEFRKLLMTPEEAVIDTPAELSNRIKIWSADGSGHAAGLMSFLDPSETLIAADIHLFKEKFDKLFIKASETEMMLDREDLYDGALMLLAYETIELLEKFNGFLERFKELRAQYRVLGNGTLSPIIPDHFMREHTYFVSKIKTYMKAVKEMSE